MKKSGNCPNDHIHSVGDRRGRDGRRGGWEEVYVVGAVVRPS